MHSEDSTSCCPRARHARSGHISLGAAPRRGPDADLPRGRDERSGTLHRRKPDLAGDTRKRCTQARRRPAAQCRAGGQRLRKSIRDATASRPTTRPTSPPLRPIQRAGVGLAAAVPLSERGRTRPGEQQVAQSDDVDSSSRGGISSCASATRLFRRAAGAVQRRARGSRKKRSRRNRWRRRSETSKSAWRDNHRHQRGRRPSTIRSWRRKSLPATTTTTQVTALRAIIGRFPKRLKQVGPGLQPLPRNPEQSPVLGRHDRRTDNLNVRVRRQNYQIATLQIDRAKAGHYPTLDPRRELRVCKHRRRRRSAFSSPAIPRRGHHRRECRGSDLSTEASSRLAGAPGDRAAGQGATGSRVRAADCLHAGADGIPGVVSSVALGQGVRAGARVGRGLPAYQSASGTRSRRSAPILDVLNCIIECPIRRGATLRQAYFNYFIGRLRLKAAIGTLNDDDIGRPDAPAAGSIRPSVFRRDAARATRPQAVWHGAPMRGLECMCRGAHPFASRRIRQQRATASVSSRRGVGVTSTQRPHAIALQVASAKLNMCGPADRWASHGDRLDQVLSSERQQAAAHESDIRGSVVKAGSSPIESPSTTSMSAAPAHCRCGGRTGIPRARSKSATASEALRMTRHDERQRSPQATYSS